MSKDKSALKVESIAATEKFEFIVSANRSSMYDTVFAQMAKLKPGQSFTVPVPKGLNPQVLQNRMNAAIRRGPTQPPAGCVFRKRTTTDGRIAICCLTSEDRAKVKKAKKAVKAKAAVAVA